MTPCEITFYTYLYLRYDGTPYYVGKGHGSRAYYKYERVIHTPSDTSRILIQEFPSEADAFAAEMFLIAYYGRIDLGTGCLRNRTDGGEGASGAVRSEATRQKLKESMIGNLHTLGYKHTEASKAKMSRHPSALTRRKLSDAKKGISCVGLKGKPWSKARRAAQEMRQAA